MQEKSLRKDTRRFHCDIATKLHHMLGAQDLGSCAQAAEASLRLTNVLHIIVK